MQNEGQYLNTRYKIQDSPYLLSMAILDANSISPDKKDRDAATSVDIRGSEESNLLFLQGFSIYSVLSALHLTYSILHTPY